MIKHLTFASLFRGTAIVILLAAQVNGQEAEPPMPEPLEVGSSAPTFTLQTLSGERFFLSRVVGANARPNLRQPVVLSFFATWCIPCREEIPQLERLQTEYPDVGIYLVDVGETVGPGEVFALVNEYVENNQIELPVLMDIYAVVAKQYRVLNDQGQGTLPKIVMVDDSQGVALWHSGYVAGDEDHYEEVIRQMAETFRASE